MNQNLYEAYEETFNKEFGKNPIIKDKYQTAVLNVVDQYKEILEKSLIDYKEISEKMVKILYIFFEIHRKDMYFSGQEIIMLCFHFVLYCYSDSSIYK